MPRVFLLSAHLLAAPSRSRADDENQISVISLQINFVQSHGSAGRRGLQTGSRTVPNGRLASKATQVLPLLLTFTYFPFLWPPDSSVGEQAHGENKQAPTFL